MKPGRHWGRVARYDSQPVGLAFVLAVFLAVPAIVYLLDRRRRKRTQDEIETTRDAVQRPTEEAASRLPAIRRAV